MIQDIEPKVFSNAFEDEPGQGGDPVIVLDGRRVIAAAGGEDQPWALPSVDDFGEGFAESFDAVFAFRIDGTRYCLAIPKAGAAMEEAGKMVKEGFCFSEIGDFRAIGGAEMRLVIATAIHLDRWYKTNRFCGRCGHETARSHKERMIECPACGNQEYPRIQPAVIVAVTDGDRLLMTRYAHAEYRLRALIAGFCEIGETAEQTVAREVLEETGVRVKNIRYVGSQPWGFASDLLLGFAAELDGDPTIRVDESELATAEWVPREEIYEEDDNLSLTRHLVMRFKRGEL